MQDAIVSKRQRLERRKRRSRKHTFGTGERPRLCVVRTLKHLYAQVVDDTNGTTLVTACTLSPELKGQVSRTWNTEAAQAVGKLIAEKAKAKGVSAVVFDRSGRKYHGRIKALADAARKSGLIF